MHDVCSKLKDLILSKLVYLYQNHHQCIRVSSCLYNPTAPVFRKLKRVSLSAELLVPSVAPTCIIISCINFTPSTLNCRPASCDWFKCDSCNSTARGVCSDAVQEVPAAVLCSDADQEVPAAVLCSDAAQEVPA